jgi:hypothetical protein
MTRFCGRRHLLGWRPQILSVSQSHYSGGSGIKRSPQQKTDASDVGDMLLLTLPATEIVDDPRRAMAARTSVRQIPPGAPAQRATNGGWALGDARFKAAA